MVLGGGAGALLPVDGAAAFMHEIADNDQRGGDDEHSPLRTLVLHLLPGALILAFYLVAAPLVRSLGFPSLLASFLAIFFVLVPFELGYLLYRARESDSTLGSVVLYRGRVPRAQLVALVLGLFAWSAICSILLYPPLDEFFIENVYFALPESFYLTEDFTRYSRAALLGTWVFGLVVNGIVGPVVEELYFRGYFLPRLSRYRAWAPFINTVLFSLYHLFTPWQNVGRIVALLPMVYAPGRRSGESPERVGGHREVADRGERCR